MGRVVARRAVIVHSALLSLNLLHVVHGIGGLAVSDSHRFVTMVVLAVLQVGSIPSRGRSSAAMRPTRGSAALLTGNAERVMLPPVKWTTNTAFVPVGHIIKHLVGWALFNWSMGTTGGINHVVLGGLSLLLFPGCFIINVIIVDDTSNVNITLVATGG